MILDEICEKKKLAVEKRKREKNIEEIYSEAEKYINVPNNFKEALRQDRISVIAEYKKASPSKGIIASDFNVEKIEEFYRKIKIDAYSVLTEKEFFMGSDEYLKKVKALSNRPILRKDFIVDPYQIYEAKAIGASGVLLIAAVLGRDIERYCKECKKIDIYPLVEVHDMEELNIALECDAEIIGINNRNLKTFKTSLNNTCELVKHIPSDKVIISESGMKTIDDIKRVEEYGVNAVLIGEMFMRNIDNEGFIKDFNDFKENCYAY